MSIGKCPQCGSDDIKAITDRSRTPPRWACMKCGHVWGGIGIWDDMGCFEICQNNDILVCNPTDDERRYISIEQAQINELKERVALLEDMVRELAEIHKGGMKAD